MADYHTTNSIVCMNWQVYFLFKLPKIKIKLTKAHSVFDDLCIVIII